MEDVEREVRYFANMKKIYSITYVIPGRKLDVLHREDGPAQVIYYLNQNKHYEGYCINGELHRLDGPAFIEYYEDGKTIKEKKYFINGKLIFDEFKYWVLAACARES